VDGPLRTTVGPHALRVDVLGARDTIVGPGRDGSALAVGHQPEALLHPGRVTQGESSIAPQARTRGVQSLEVPIVCPTRAQILPRQDRATGSVADDRWHHLAALGRGQADAIGDPERDAARVDASCVYPGRSGRVPSRDGAA